MQDPYAILGVARGATQAEVKQSYRRLAKEWHPDRQQGDSAATDKFKEIAASYHLLGDARRRSRFDQGEIDAAGNRRANFRKSASARKKPQAKSSGRGNPGAHAAGANFDAGQTAGQQGAADASTAKARTKEPHVGAQESVFENFGFGGFSASDIFQPFFRNRRGEEKEPEAAGAKDHRYQLEIGLLDAIKGGKKRLTLNDGRHVFVSVPPGTEDGQVIRLKGMGEKSSGGKSDGDALVEIKITPHPHFIPMGRDIHLELPVTVQEAVQGARVDVLTIDGPVSVTVPRGSNAGTRLRLKGKGIPDKKGGPPGDQHLTIRIVLPDNNDDFKRLVGDWAKLNDYDVRAGFRRA